MKSIILILQSPVYILYCIAYYDHLPVIFSLSVFLQYYIMICNQIILKTLLEWLKTSNYIYYN